MRRPTALFTATLLLFGVGVAGFAGVAAAGERLTEKEFLKRANSICKATNKELDALFEEAFAGLDPNGDLPPERAEAVLSEVIPIFRGALRDVDRLRGPASLEKRVDKLLDQYGAAVDEIEADPVAAFSYEHDPFAKADKAARKLGLKQCGQD